jgi:hypothetical protein
MATRHLFIVIGVHLVALVAASRGSASAGDAGGSLLVESDPAGASVYVDGRLAGETPLALPAIAAGVHRVRVCVSAIWRTAGWSRSSPGARATLARAAHGSGPADGARPRR